MRKGILIIIAVLLLLTATISCNNDGSVDETFTVTVSFDGNGADAGTMTPQMVGRGIPVKLKDNAFLKTDFYLAEWNTEADGSGIHYPAGKSVKTDVDLTLYAQWAHKEVTIKYDANGGTGEMPPQVVYTNTATVLSANAFTLEDYLVKNWNTAADGSGTTYAKGQEISIEEDITLYAQWEPAIKVLTSEMTSWTDGYIYTLDSDVTIGDTITVYGAVTLLLPDGFTLTASKGIIVNSGNSITINSYGDLGTGTLQATGVYMVNNAAIGSDSSNDAGSITINGGRVNAQGSLYSAGIGGGVNRTGGDITINGGIVNATGGYGGAGIGGGYQAKSGAITINGGIVNATGDSAPGIGGGIMAAAETITITGGSITATAGDTSAGIGGSRAFSGGTITITGGSIVATGGDHISGNPYPPGPGIGGGANCANDVTLILGEGVMLQVSSDNSTWSDYTDSGAKYMKTK